MCACVFYMYTTVCVLHVLPNCLLVKLLCIPAYVTLSRCFWWLFLSSACFSLSKHEFCFIFIATQMSHFGNRFSCREDLLVKLLSEHAPYALLYLSACKCAYGYIWNFLLLHVSHVTLIISFCVSQLGRWIWLLCGISSPIKWKYLSIHAFAMVVLELNLFFPLFPCWQSMPCTCRCRWIWDSLLSHLIAWG